MGDSYKVDLSIIPMNEMKQTGREISIKLCLIQRIQKNILSIIKEYSLV